MIDLAIRFIVGLIHSISTPEFMARVQFAMTVIIHFIFPPLTIGLSLFTAIVQTMYAATGKEKYKYMAKFWGRLFLINFAAGVVTGIVMEFEFGMNWAQFSSFVGNVFGVPLAIEVIVAFFMESVFIGIWLFGWDVFNRKVHVIFIWLVALGTNLSAFWILVANSFMQEPAGYVIKNGHADLVNFLALISTKQVQLEFLHTFFAGMCTASFLIIAVCAYHLIRNKFDVDIFKSSLRIVSLYALIGTVGVAWYGHLMGDRVAEMQPMKLAAMEALWNTENPASEGVFVITDQSHHRNYFSIKVPGVLSYMVYGKFSGAVKGMNEIQKEYEQKYGPGDYIPSSVFLNFYAFRAMVAVGILMLLISIYLFIKSFILNKYNYNIIFLIIMIISVLFPYIGCTAGWVLTECGRQPWMVQGLLLVKDSISPNVSYLSLWISNIVLFVVFGIITLIDIYLLIKFSISGTKDFRKEEKSV